jgi:predicted HicB family RNase H-like nuclease
VRFAADALRTMEAKAKAAKQSLSEWIRSTLDAAMERMN